VPLLIIIAAQKMQKKCHSCFDFDCHLLIVVVCMKLLGKYMFLSESFYPQTVSFVGCCVENVMQPKEQPAD
jgi:hypothetical protein